MGKAQLLSALGMSAEAKAHKSQATRRKAISFNATKEGGDSSVKKALVKGRIVRSIKRGLVAEEKKQGRALTQQEKRTVAARALATEVKAIKAGKPENKPDRGGNHLEAQISNTKAAIADVQANIHKAKEISASTGQPFDRYHKAMRGQLEQHKASLSKLEKQQLAVINQGLKHGHSIQPIEGGYAMFQGSDRIGNLTAKTPQQVLAKSQKFEQETEGYQSQKGDRKKMSVVSGGQKTKGKSGANLTSVEGGSQSLQDLFKAADRIGNKYQDGKDPADLGAKRAAKQMRQETGVASLVDRATGGSGLRALDGGKGKKPGTVTDIGSAHSAQTAAMNKRSSQRDEEVKTGKAKTKALEEQIAKNRSDIAELEAKGKKSSFSHTPPPGVSVAEHRANLRRQYGATSGTRNENLSKKEERRSEIGRGDEGESRIRRGEVADRVSEPSSGSGQLRNEHTARQVWGDKAIDKVLSHTKEKPADRVSESEKAKKPSATLLKMAKNLHNLDSKDTHILRQMAATHLGLDVSDIKEMRGNDRGLTVTRRSGQKTLIPAGKSTASKPESKAPDRVTEPEKAKDKSREKFEAEASKNPKLKKYLELKTGKAVSDKKIRETLGLSQDELIQLGHQTRKLLGITPMQTVREGLSRLYGDAPNQKTTVTRGTKATPWAGTDAPTKTRSSRGEMVRGRSID